MPWLGVEHDAYLKSKSKSDACVVEKDEKLRTISWEVAVQARR